MWHDGQPVTAADCIASIERWGAGTSMGQQMMSSVAGMKALDARTFRMKLKEPYGLVLEIARQADLERAVHHAREDRRHRPRHADQVEDVIGSGPFMFKREQWKPGVKAVFIKNQGYRPRSEPPSGPPAARSPRSTGSNGSGSRTPRPRSTR